MSKSVVVEEENWSGKRSVLRAKPNPELIGKDTMADGRRKVIIVVCIIVFIVMGLASGYIFVISASHGHGLTELDWWSIFCLGLGATISAMIGLRYLIWPS